MIVCSVLQRPDGWVYSWYEAAEGAEAAHQWEGRRDTLEEALEALRASIRERLPKGFLQGDTKSS